MKLILDNLYDEELKEYLSLQEGVINVSLGRVDEFNIVNIEFDDTITTAQILYKYIQLFEQTSWSELVGFEKDTKYKSKTLKYLVDDLCCDYCYRGFVEQLFKNENVKSVNSNYDYHKPLFNIEFIIEYNEDYIEEELIEYIKKEL